MTTEEKLKAIIQAQCEGGYEKYDVFPRGFEMYVKGSVILHHRQPEDESTFGVCPPYSVLEILLDTQGAKAAYGLSATVEQAEKIEGGSIMNVEVTPFWILVTQQILDKWHSGEHGNNYKSSIDTAYEFLPKK